MAVGAVALLQLERRLRADNAVIVLELVGKLQRAARLPFRILGERDGRRLVRDGGELPGDVAAADAAHGRRAGLVDHEAALLGALGRRSPAPPGAGSASPPLATTSRCTCPVARMTSVLPAGTDSVGGGLHRLARPQALQDHRRPAGIGRRAHPGVDAEIGRHASRPASRRPRRCASCARRRRRRRSRPPAPATRRAHGERIARGQPRRRHPGLERLGRAQRPLDMGAPQRHGEQNRSVGAAISSAIAVAGRCGRPVLRSSRRRPSIRLGMRSIRNGAKAAAVSRKKTPSPIGPPDRRQPQPEAEPGHGQEQADHGGDRRQRRPQPLPENRPARAAERPRQHARRRPAPARGGAARALRWVGASGDRSVNYVSSKENLADCQY